MTKSIKNINTNKKAFTLVEIMVAIMLTTIVLTAVFMIWSRVRAGIAKSTTKQKLQNELRKAANYFQNDFKTIKYYDPDNPEEASKAINRTGDDENWTLTFEKFDELKESDDKLAQDVSKKVTYEKKNSMLTRNIDGKTNILSVSVENVNIKRTTQDNNEYENADDDLKSAKDAKLDIEITGKMTVPGSSDDMYLTEKTSVVMRNEYYKNINKTFISTFDLTKKSADKVIEAGDASLLEQGGELDLEFLKTLDDDVLSGMDATQKDMLEEAMERMDDLNKAIKDTDTGESGWSKFWNGVAFWDKSEGEKVRDMRSELAKIKPDISKDEKDLDKIDQKYNEAIEKVEDVKSRLQSYTKDKEEEFLKKSISNYSSLTDAEKDVYKKAYEMKLQDRNIQGGYDKLSDEEKEEMGGQPTLNIDRISGKNVEDVTITNKDNTTTTTSSMNNNTLITAENKEVIAAYEKIDLDWMGDFGDEPEDVGIYNAAKQLITQADTKIDILRMEHCSASNRGKIDIAMNSN